ncbi:MAG: hypothetical protein GX591_02405 [Planctomycetes bacterium]|nr:hypothetical protein [Planctomycetota bacterium]
MAWLFERTIELAAWVAFILAGICLVDSVYVFYQFIRVWMNGETAPVLAFRAGQAAGGFVLFSLVMGLLACIDRYVFDQPQAKAR